MAASMRAASMRAASISNEQRAGDVAVRIINDEEDNINEIASRVKHLHENMTTGIDLQKSKEKLTAQVKKNLSKKMQQLGTANTETLSSNVRLERIKISAPPIELEKHAPLTAATQAAGGSDERQVFGGSGWPWLAFVAGVVTGIAVTVLYQAYKKSV